MPDAREIPAVLEAAAQAAAAGDLASAETLLHEVVTLQEARLSPLHPDLASTYNNLAVVCEMAGKSADAEQFYRRAYAIASRSLEPDDPLVTTSRNNLREFCEARGIPVDPAAGVMVARDPISPPAPPAPEAEKPPRAAEPSSEPRAVAPATIRNAETVTTEPVPAKVPRDARSANTSIIGVIAAVVILTILSMAWSWRLAQTPDATVEPAATDVPPAPAPTAAPPAAETPTATAPARTLPPAPKAPEKPVAARPAQPDAADVRLLEAKVCQGLSTEGAWRCTAPSNPAAAGRLSFFTRVAARDNVRIRHRWYHGDRLVQDVGLDIRANPTAGFRTYSRQTVSATGGSDWRVEVRTPAGALLGEERFVVR